MKGTIVIALQDLVKNKFGQEKWINILKKSDLPTDKVFYAHHDVDDSIFMTLLQNTCKVLGITLEQVAEAFGNYWMNEYAPKKYFAFFIGKRTAKEFLLDMDRVHSKMVDKIENARPPRFEFEELDDNKITMSYSSHRGLELIWIGLIKGVGRYFKEDIKIKKIGKNKVELTFSKIKQINIW